MDYLLDSSVVIKWFVEEENSDKALKIQSDYLDGKLNIIIPDLLFYEVANGLRYSPYKISKERIMVDIESLIKLYLEVIVFNWDIFQKAVRLMFEFDITIYDAYFLSLAKELGLIFVTADERLYLKIKNLSYIQLLQYFNSAL